MLFIAGMQELYGEKFQAPYKYPVMAKYVFNISLEQN